MSTKVFVWQGQARGGAERITLEVARYLAKQGYDITLGMYEADIGLTQTTPPLKQLVLPVPRWVPSSFKSLSASALWRWRYAKRYRAVYAHTLGWWKTGTNQVFMHDAADLDLYHAHPASPAHALASRLWRWLYLTLSLRPATLILSASRDFTRYLERHSVPDTKVKPSGSFYDETIFHATSPVRQPQPPYTLLFIGTTADPRKNFQLVRQAFYNQPDFKVIIFGSPEVAQDANFDFRGYVNSEQLAHALHTSDLFIMPSQGEGFSIALLEALATGIPCLVNEAAVNPELAYMQNLVTFDMAAHQRGVDNFRNTARHILSKYSYYAGVDPEITKFSRAAILEQEYQAMRPYLDARPTASETNS